MRKRLYSFLLLLMVATMGFAQQVKTQGVPRKGARIAKSTPATVMPAVDFGKIAYWVGDTECEKRAALVIKWSDGKGNDKNLVWGYRFDKATGEQMIRDIAAADPRFYALVYGNTPYGAAIGGMGFDLDNDNDIALVNNGVRHTPTNGVFTTQEYDFDNWAATDAADHWCAGWMNGYWSYWTTNSISHAFDYSDVGASSRVLTNNSIDGWAFMSDMINWYSNDMSGELEYVQAPNSVRKSTKNTKARAAEGEYIPQTLVVGTASIDNFQELVAQANDGDTIKFREGLRGSVIDNSSNNDLMFKVRKKLVILGNGVIFKGGKGLNITSKSGGSIHDITFTEVERPLRVIAPEFRIENCIFDNCIDISVEAFYTEENNFDIEVVNCRFSRAHDGDAALYICDRPMASEQYHVTAKVLSCTFADNRIPSVGFHNSYDIAFANNVIIGRGSDSFEDVAYSYPNNPEGAKLTSHGYNVIAGTMTNNGEGILTSTDKIGTDLPAALIFADGEYKVVKDGPAYQNVPAGTVLEGIAWPEKDIIGLPVDNTMPMHSGACQQVYAEQLAIDYSKGVFILNEDWYGHQNSTLNFLTDEGEWVYRVVQKENEGVQLGATAQYGTIYGDRFYIMSKQDKDPGASVQGARLSVFDAKTMKMIKQFATLGEEGGDGRGFLGVSLDKAYVGTNKGIRVLNLQTLEFTGSVTGSGNDEADGSYGSLYNAQVGNMVRVGDHVFAVHQKEGLLVINPETDKVDQVIKCDDGELFSSVVAGADGNLWLSVGTGMPENKLGKLNPHTLELEFIDLPEGTYGPANSWYAWTPDGFCASRQHNVLYWNGGSSSWFTGKTIYRYDIDKNECTLMLDYNNDPDGWQQYGCSFRVDPVTDCIYTSLYKAFGDPSYVLRKYSGEGELLAEYPMITNYWFPSLPIFPDNAAPVVAALADVRADEAQQIALADVATDADNFDMLIVKRVKEVSDAEVLTAEVKADSLILTPLKNGEAVVTLQFNSNGKVTEASLNVTIEGIADGVNDVRGTSVVVSMTDLSGRAISGKGGQRIVIQRMSDGTTRKVMR